MDRESTSRRRTSDPKVVQRKIDYRRKRGMRPLENLANKRKSAQTLVPTILQVRREGRTYAEIGALLGLSCNAAIGLMHRANADVK
jgi:hypothetical protein